MQDMTTRISDGLVTVAGAHSLQDSPEDPMLMALLRIELLLGQLVESVGHLPVRTTREIEAAMHRERHR